jgi:hypothetical protein
LQTFASPADALAVLAPQPSRVQQTLQTDRSTLVPLADEHFEWEVELDSDFEVMRYLGGRASTRVEVVTGRNGRMHPRRRKGGG